MKSINFANFKSQYLKGNCRYLKLQNWVTKTLMSHAFFVEFTRKEFILSYSAANSPTSQRARESCYKLKKKWEPLAKVNPVGEIWWRPPELKTFQKWENFGRGSEQIPITYAIVTATSKVKLFKSSGAVGYLNTWLPRSISIYSNNTLLTAGCCKSELRYLKHWYCRLCPGLVKPILGHSFGRSWYKRLFHTPSTSFL